MLTADGVPILMHDETLERTTTGRGRVADLTLAEIRRFDAGGCHHWAFAVSPAPTFEEALARCARLGVWANVEIKPATGHEEDTGRVVAAMLAASPLAGHAVLSSFSDVALRAARSAAPSLPRAVLFENPPADWHDRMRQHEACALHFAANAASPELLAAARAAKLTVACYTVNRRDEADALMAAGVASVFSDRPDLWMPEEM